MGREAPPRVGVACSGGRDSTALLHATARAAASLGLEVRALHVHHGLLPEADAWWRALEGRCRRWRRAGWPVAFCGARVPGRPAPGDSIEAWARRARYRALAELAQGEGITLVLLAHHRRDQAETVLLQALRGAGAPGLSAMPKVVVREGITQKTGRLPVNASGGLKSKGHPIGATGVSMHVMAAMQLAGTAPEGLQLPKAKLGGVFNMGGAAVANYVSVLERVK